VRRGLAQQRPDRGLAEDLLLQGRLRAQALALAPGLHVPRIVGQRQPVDVLAEGPQAPDQRRPLGPHHVADRPQPQPLRAREVEERLVQTERLDGGREASEDVHDLHRDLLVALEVRQHHDRVGSSRTRRGRC
jgi:hypothetical protein